MGSFKMKTVTLVDTWCGVCGIDFAMPDWLYKARRDDGQAFWCPRGCRIGYTESEADRLRRQVKRLESRTVHLEDQRRAAEKSAAAYKGQVTKLRTRVANGVCPCCQRTFVQLQRHMRTKHPDYVDPEQARHG